MKQFIFTILLFGTITWLPQQLSAAPDMIFGTGNTRVEVYFPCNPQNGCSNDCAATQLKASVPGNWSFMCSGNPNPISYSNTATVCFNCSSFTVTFTYLGQTSTATVSAPFPNINANFITTNVCQTPVTGPDVTTERASAACLLCVVSTSTATCPIEAQKWKVTYDCPSTPIYNFVGPGPHNIPIHPINIKVCLTVTAGCEKTVCKYYRCKYDCDAFAEPAPFDVSPDEIIQLLEEEFVEEVMLWPNPTHGSVHVANLPETTEGKYSAELFDVLGRQVEAYSLEVFDNEADILIGDVAPGIYVIALKDSAGKTLHVQRLAVE